MPKTTHAGPSNTWEEQLVEEQAEETETLQPVQEPEVEEEVVQEEEQPQPETTGTPSAADVRTWAKDNGVEISDRGVISTSVIEQYLVAHQEF